MSDGNLGIYAPELQIINESTFTTGNNQTNSFLWNYADTVAPTVNTKAPVLNIAGLVQLADAGNYSGMVDDVNLLLFANGMSSTTWGALTTMLQRLHDNNRTSSELARSLLLLALVSPEYAIQR